MRVALTCLALFAASPAFALSCLAPDIVWLYQHIKEDEADYVLVRGKVRPTEPPNLAEPSGMKPSEAFTRAYATGHALSASGFNARFDRPITIRVTCAGSWCGEPEGLEDDTHIFAVRLDGDSAVLDRGPCSGLAQRWTPEEETRLLDCHLKGKCELKGF